MLLLLVACLSRYLDAPLVLATGLGPLRTIDAADPEHLLVSADDRAWRVDGTGKTEAAPLPPSREVGAYPLPDELRDATAVVELPDGNRLVLSPTQVWTAWPERAGEATTWRYAVLAENLVDARAIAADARGRVYVVSGAPEPELYRVDGEHLTLIARWVGDVRDMRFGPGGPLLPADNLYLVRADGILAYLRPP